MLHKGKILVVDDKLENIQVLYSLLGGEGYEVNAATNGPQALKDVQNERPDLILLDVNMPKMDGFEVCKKLKAQSDTSRIPVIFITANNDDQKISEGFKAGAVDYVTKPIKTDELTSRINTHLQLQRAVLEAESANRAKDEFLAMISHEIRTPLNVIMGFTQLLSEKCEGDVLNQINLINSAGNSLLNLIQDVLDVSKIEAGKISIEKSPFSPDSMLKEIHNIFKAKVEEKGLSFKLQINGTIPSFVISDEHRIRQTLYNLLSNALKFTNQGHIGIKAHATTHEQKCDLTIEVADSGRGIPEQELTKIFEKYSQVNQKSDTQLGGTGLGLSISKQLIQLLNGKLLVESEWGKGSKFTILLKDLDTLSQTKSFNHDTEEHTFDLEDILIVDDKPENRRLLAHYLAGTGLSFRTAENGHEALTAIQCHKPDLILMDLQMDIMDGFQATKFIRSDQELKDIPVIVITANQLHNVDNTLFNSCLLKPIDRYDLLNEIAFLLRQKSESQSKAPRAIKLLPLKKILAEDQKLVNALKVNQEVLQNSYTYHDLNELLKIFENIPVNNQYFTEHIKQFKNAIDIYDMSKTSKWLKELNRLFH